MDTDQFQVNGYSKREKLKLLPSRILGLKGYLGFLIVSTIQKVLCHVFRVGGKNLFITALYLVGKLIAYILLLLSLHIDRSIRIQLFA